MLASPRVHGARRHGLLAMLAALLLPGLDALAQGTIVYRDIEDVPLFTLSGSVFYDLDLDQNGSVDLTFRARATDFSAYPAASNHLLAIPATPPDLGGYMYPLDFGEVVGPSPEPPLSWENPGDGRLGPVGLAFTSCMLVGDDLGCLGLFTGRNAYMGVEFQIDGQPHYGWVRLDVSQVGFNGGWITEYAYDTRPGMPILAGAVPEPSTWALLVGGGVLMMWSRRKRRGRREYQNHWSEQPPCFAVRESRASALRSGCRESRALSRRGGCRSVLAFGEGHFMNTTKGETMYSSKMLMWVVSAAYLLPATLQAATYLLVPPYAIEQSSLSNDPLDDSVEVYSGPQDPQPLYPGDKVIWDYEYRTSYEVLSPDLADINELRVYGPALAGNPTVNVSLQLTDPQHNFIDPGYKFDSIAWGTDSVLVSDADDVLGNLSGLAIGGFHLEITMVSGSAGFGGARFNWGASDIAVVPEASTLMLLGLGAGLLGVCYRHRS